MGKTKKQRLTSSVDKEWVTNKTEVVESIIGLGVILFIYHYNGNKKRRGEQEP